MAYACTCNIAIAFTNTHYLNLLFGNDTGFATTPDQAPDLSRTTTSVLKLVCAYVYKHNAVREATNMRQRAIAFTGACKIITVIAVTSNLDFLVHQQHPL